MQLGGRPQLTMYKSHFRAIETDYLGRTVNPQGVKPEKQNVQNFPQKEKQISKVEKGFTTLFGIPELPSNLCPNTLRTPTPILQDDQNDKKVLVSKKLVQKLEAINKALDKCCDLVLQPPLPNKQIALMTDAGYAVVIDDDPNQKFTSLHKSYAPVDCGSKTFSPTQIKMSTYAKEFLAIYFAFSEERRNRSLS